MRPRRSPSLIARAGGFAVVAVGVAVGASLLLPFIRSQNAWLEWTSALWLVERQAEAIRDLGHPTYFLHTDVSGAFYPQFLFYGGPLFAAAGGLAVAFGSAWGAFITVLAAASAAAFGGTLWLGRQLGLSLGVAALPALVTLTSPYVVTNLYGRGAFAEIVALSAIPLALAGLLSILTADRPWIGVCALAASAATVAGSHNITLVWGSLVCAAIVAIAAWAAGRRGLRTISRGRAVAVVGGLLLGVALVAWTVVPAAVYGPDTRAYADTRSFLDALPQLDRLDVVLSPVPSVPQSVGAGNPTSYYQVPVYVLAWAAAAIVAAVWRGRAGRVDRRLGAGLSMLLALLLALLVASAPWDHIPGILAAIQFPLRLHAYVVLVAALLVIVALRMLRDDRRRPAWLAALVAALVVQTTFAESAAWGGRTFYTRNVVTSATLPPAFGTFQSRMYLLEEGSLPRERRPTLRPSAATMSGDRLVLEGLRSTADRYRSTIVASEFVRVRAPWRAVGHDRNGLVVVSAPPGTTELVAEPAAPWPVALGTALSLAALAIVLAGGAVVLVWRGGRAFNGRARRA